MSEETFAGRERLLESLASKQEKFSISQYMRLANISRATAYRDLTQAVKSGWLKKYGSGRGTYYTAKKST